eukprot:359520_1
MSRPFIGILDVFGFECFESNSFEQFCINYANERLQSFFNLFVIKSEQNEYIKEGIHWKEIETPDNAECLNLIKETVGGLDTTCRMPGGTPEVFVTNLMDKWEKKNPYLSQVSLSKLPKAIRLQKERWFGFSIKHFAGTVVYDARLFLSKNEDATHSDTLTTFVKSETHMVAEIFKSDPTFHTHGQRKRFRSLGSTFLRQMGDLMEHLEQTQPHFVRCVSPNAVKQAKNFDDEYVRHQLRVGGLIEALNVVKLGYPTRVYYDLIYKMYCDCPSVSFLKGLSARDFSEGILIAFGLDKKDYQMGISKIFFRPNKANFMEKIMKSGGTLSEECMDRLKEWKLNKHMMRWRACSWALGRLGLMLRVIRARAAWNRVGGLAHVVAMTFGRSLKRARLRIYQRNLLQAIIRTQATIRMKRVRDEYMAEKRRRGAAWTLILAWRRFVQRRALCQEIARRIFAKKSVAALSIFKFWRKNHCRHKLVRELSRRHERRVLKAQQELRARREAEEREQKRLEEEEFRRREEEEERLRQKEEEERLRKEEEERKLQEEEELRIKEEERRQKEEEDRRIEEERRQQEEEERRIKEEERRQKEEEEHRIKEEERRVKEEEDRRRHEEEERLRLERIRLEEEAHLERLRLEEEARQERVRREEEERLERIQREEEAMRVKEEEERLRLERIRLAEEAHLERLRLEEEARLERTRREEEERLERIRREEEVMRVKEEEAHLERLRLEEARLERIRREEEERLERIHREEEAMRVKEEEERLRLERIRLEEEARLERTRREEEERLERIRRGEEAMRAKEEEAHLERLRLEEVMRAKEEEAHLERLRLEEERLGRIRREEEERLQRIRREEEAMRAKEEELRLQREHEENLKEIEDQERRERLKREEEDRERREMEYRERMAREEKERQIRIQHEEDERQERLRKLEDEQNARLEREREEMHLMRRQQQEAMEMMQKMREEDVRREDKRRERLKYEAEEIALQNASMRESISSANQFSPPGLDIGSLLKSALKEMQSEGGSDSVSSAPQIGQGRIAQLEGLVDKTFQKLDSMQSVLQKLEVTQSKHRSDEEKQSRKRLKEEMRRKFQNFKDLMENADAYTEAMCIRAFESLEFVLKHDRSDRYLQELASMGGAGFVVDIYVQAATAEPVFLKNHQRQVYSAPELLDHSGKSVLAECIKRSFIMCLAFAPISRFLLMTDKASHRFTYWMKEISLRKDCAVYHQDAKLLMKAAIEGMQERTATLLSPTGTFRTSQSKRRSRRNKSSHHPHINEVFSRSPSHSRAGSMWSPSHSRAESRYSPSNSRAESMRSIGSYAGDRQSRSRYNSIDSDGRSPRSGAGGSPHSRAGSRAGTSTTYDLPLRAPADGRSRSQSGLSASDINLPATDMSLPASDVSLPASDISLPVSEYRKTERLPASDRLSVESIGFEEEEKDADL